MTSIQLPVVKTTDIIASNQMPAVKNNSLSEHSVEIRDAFVECEMLRPTMQRKLTHGLDMSYNFIQTSIFSSKNSFHLPTLV